ncbi:sensor histidine kinase [Pseudoalteromonas fenneropenaei]|uniref:Sensor histidine kinase n=1 Tax=Pseudoalteromonas fenneropenaei TaxID=1737459 RepID=A0ABV7CG55_9GAMM
MSLLDSRNSSSWWVLFTLHCALLPALLFVTNETRQHFSLASRYTGLGIAVALLVALLLQEDNSIILIYSIMLSAILAFYLPKWAYYSYIPAFLGLYLLAQAFYWHNGWRWVDVALFGCFHLFALVLSERMNQEQQAKENLQLANNQLAATSHLLSQAAAERERISLARELHDDVGHHLTSLILMLDVARRTHPQDDNLALCYQQARSCLTSVREVVSDKRQLQPVAIQTTLKELTRNLPNLTVTLDIASDLKVEDLNQAHCLLRTCQEAITNALKHSQASLVNIKIVQTADDIVATIADNGGHCPSLVNPGNGLLGLAERASACNAELSWNCTQARCFQLVLRIKL